MAHFFLPFTLLILTILSLIFPASGTFWKSVKPSPFNLGTEKLSHFQFYWHVMQSGSNRTSSINIPPTNISWLGYVNMIINDPLTQRPEIDSKILGRARGLYAVASPSSQDPVIGKLLATNFVFIAGRYNGSSLSVVGWNPFSQEVWEMPVIGGTGHFRFARGYVHARTHQANMKMGDAIVKYHAYVLHF